MWPDEELDSEKILKSIPDGFRAIDSDSGKELQVGDKFIHLVLEAIPI